MVSIGSLQSPVCEQQGDRTGDSVIILDLSLQFATESPEDLLDTGYWVPLPDLLIGIFIT